MATTKIKVKSDGRKNVIAKRVEKLTNAQQQWCHEMAADPMFNATAAARKAGYKTPGQAAQKNLNNKTVQAYLGKVLHERQQRCELTADEVLHQLRNALFLDPMMFYDQHSDGTVTPKQLQDIPEELRRCITELETKVVEDEYGNKITTFRYKTINKDNAFTLAMKHLGLMAPDGSINVNVSGVGVSWDELARGPAIEGKVKGKEKK